MNTHLPQATADANDIRPDSEQFVVGLYIQALLEAYAAQKGNLETLAKSCDVSLIWLCHPPDKISIERYLRLLKAAQTITGDPHFGLHIGQHMHASTFDVLGRAMLNADNLGQATEQVLALEGLVHTLGHSQVYQEPGYIRFVWRCHYQRHPQVREIVESVLAGIIHFAQRLAGRPIPVMEATFMHSAPATTSMAEYRRICRSTCYFDQPYNSILVADEVLALPVNLTVQHTQSLFTPLASSHAKTGVTTAPLSHQLNHYLEAVLADGNPSLAAVAKHYHMTARTLQRRLAQEGSSFQQLLNTARARLAEDYLRYTKMTAFEVSQMLGFKEQSSFNHFFTDKFGLSPSEYRLRNAWSIKNNTPHPTA